VATTLSVASTPPRGGRFVSRRLAISRVTWTGGTAKDTSDVAFKIN